MMRHIVKIKILALSIFIFLSLPYLYAQEKVDARQEARQHYLQGKELYSQGRYEEATSEFEKAVELVSPSKVEFIEGLEKEQQKGLVTKTNETPISSKEKLTEKKEAGIKEVKATVPATKENSPEAGEGERQYYIDIGDVLDISVWQVPDLSRPEVIVRPDGKISFPLIGDIKTEGLTLTQLGDIITGKLKKYVKTPEVSIMIRGFGEQANKVVVLGEILNPGIYKFGGPPTITEAVAAAGGYSKYAVLNSIMIIRGDVKGKPEAIRVNVAQILKAARLSENILLKPNDIVYVPRSFIGKVNTFLEIFQPAVNEYLQTLNAHHLQNTIRSKGGI